MAVTTTPSAPQAPEAGGGKPTEERGRIGGGLLDPKILWKSLPAAFKKLDPRVQIKNPVMFVVEVGALLTLYTAIFDDKQPAFNWTIVVFLWLTVVFANLAEAVAEGRGKAQAESLRRTKRETVARRSVSACALPRPSATASAMLAKTTVSHRKTTTVQLKAGCLSLKIAV